MGLFVVHHLEGRNLRFDLRQLILDRYFPASRTPRVPVPRAEAADRLRRFAGTYRASIFCHSCKDGGPNVQDFEVTANNDGTLSVWGDRWVEVSPLYFVSADGRKRIGFAEDKAGRVFALSGGSWRVIERVGGGKQRRSRRPRRTSRNREDIFWSTALPTVPLRDLRMLRAFVLKLLEKS